MILVLTNSDDATADYLCKRMASESVSYFRFDTDSDLQRIKFDYRDSSPQLTVDHTTLFPGNIDHIWYRRPQPLRPPSNAPDPEAWQIAYEWSEAIEAFLAHVPLSSWINHPSRNAGASRKLEQLTRAQSLGLNIPKTLVTQSRDSLTQFWRACNGRLIVKPLACGYLERDEPENDTHIYTNQITEADLSEADSLQHCPTFFQELVDKVTDVRIVVVDDSITAVAMYGTDDSGRQRVDIRRNNMSDVRYDSIVIPDIVRQSLTRLCRSYELRFAAIDMAIDQAGNWVFFEINPNGQWAWLDLAGAADVSKSFMQAFKVAAHG